MSSITRGDLCIEYLDEGRGPPVILVHSSVSGNRQWRRLVETLSPTYRCLAPNLFGYGQTTPWPADRQQTLADAASVVVAICEFIDEPIRLIGHSWGGAVAMFVANTLGPRVSHLALYEPMLYGLLLGQGRTEAESEALRMHGIVRERSDAGDWEGLAQIFTDYFNGDGSWASTPPDRRAAVSRQLPPNRHEWDASGRPVNAEMFSSISAKTMVLRGSSTRLVTRETVSILTETFPHWDLREVEGAGHMGPLTHGGTVNPLVATFLGS
jgi:pimeloyl-ACP methyl ester carboxylesterase